MAQSRSRPREELIRAGHAVVATNSSIVDRVALHSKMSPYRTYVIGFAIDRGALPDALYWDTEEPYHYVRLQPGDNGRDFVLVGGEDHKSGEADDADKRFERLEQWARGKMPMLKDVTHRWSGQVLDTIDYAGFIGKNPGIGVHLCRDRGLRTGPDAWRDGCHAQCNARHRRRKQMGASFMRPTASH